MLHLLPCSQTDGQSNITLSKIMNPTPVNIEQTGMNIEAMIDFYSSLYANEQGCQPLAIVQGGNGGWKLPPSCTDVDTTSTNWSSYSFIGYLIYQIAIGGLDCSACVLSQSSVDGILHTLATTGGQGGSNLNINLTGGNPVPTGGDSNPDLVTLLASSATILVNHT